MLESLCVRCQHIFYWYESFEDWRKIAGKEVVRWYPETHVYIGNAVESCKAAKQEFDKWAARPCTCNEVKKDE